MLYCGAEGAPTATIYAAGIADSSLTELRRIHLDDPTGAMYIVPMDVTPDGAHYLYTVMRYQTGLYLVEGLR